MPYRLSLADDVADAARLVAREQLEGAIADLERAGRGGDDAADAVHEARKQLKKTRALLRLLRPALGQSAYRSENDALRDVARALSATRDADVLVETVERLADRFAGRLPASDFERVRSALAAEASAGRGGGDAPRADLAAELHDALARVDTWPLDGARWDDVLAGATRQYAGGRDRQAGPGASVEQLHEWRKRVKDLWYHHRLLRDAFGPVMGAYDEAAHELSELLGDDHDLAVLHARLQRGLAQPAGAAVDPEPLLALVDERRGELEQAAQRLGARLYAESPKAWRRRVGRWLRAAVDEAASTSAPAAVPPDDPPPASA